MKRAILAIACVLCVASVSDAQNFRMRSDGRGGYRVYGDSYYGRIRSDGRGGYRGNLYNYGYNDYQRVYIRQPHMQYDPFSGTFYPSYGPKIGVYPGMNGW